MRNGSRIGTVALAAAALLLPGVTHASGDAPFLTRSEARTLAAADIDVQQLAPGWELVDDDLVWDDGAVMVSVTPMAASDCDAGYLCFWEDKNFTGRRLQFQSNGLRGDMRDYSFNDKMSSWRNRLAKDARWYYNYDGTGTSRCMDNGTRNSDVGAGLLNVDNDEMSSFRIYAGSDKC